MTNLIKNFYKTDKFKFYLVVFTFCIMLALAIIFKLRWIDFIPVSVSLVIMILQANVNRYAFLLGAINSFFYAIVYVLDTLYASVFYAILVSAPLQFITFINWKKKTNEKGNTELRKMSNTARLILILGVLALWIIAFFIFNLLGSPYVVFDNTTFILGILITVLTMLRYVEYTVFQAINQAITLALYIVMTFDQPAKIVYVVYAIYTTICVFMAIIKIRKQLKNKDEKLELKDEQNQEQPKQEIA